MRSAMTRITQAFVLLTSMTALAIIVTPQSAFAQVPENPPYEIVVSGEGENPLALEITINFANGSSILHSVQGNGTIQYENPGYGDIESMSFQGQTIRQGEEVVIQIGETEVCYRIFFWWFDSGYYRMTYRREVLWA